MRARVDVVGLVVADMARSLAFYRRLGLDLPPDADREPHVEFALGDGVRLAWDTEEVVRSFAPHWAAQPGHGRISLAARLDAPADVDALFKELVAAGHSGEVEPFDAFWGQRYAVVRDPDGNGVDLYADMPS